MAPEVWPPLKENQGAGDAASGAPVAVTFTSLPWSVKEGLTDANFSPVQTQRTPVQEEANCEDSGGELE